MSSLRGNSKYDKIMGANQLVLTSPGSYAQVPSVNLQKKVFTLAFWVKLKNVNGIHPVFGCSPNIMVFLDERRLKIVRHAAGDTFEFMSATALFPKNRHLNSHLAVTWNTNEVTIYADGKKTDTATPESKFFDGVDNTWEWFDIGRNGTEQTMNGYLYDLYFINQVLTEKEIYAIAFQGKFVSIC